MPLPLILAAVVAEEVVDALILWGVRALGLSLGAAIVSEASKEEAAPATQADTTTVVGKGTMKCGDSGKYEDMLKQTGDGKLDRDHVPSKAALKQAAKDILEDTGLIEKITQAQWDALFGKGSNPGQIAKQGQTIAIPKKDHQKNSDTYGRRNSPEKIDEDAKIFKTRLRKTRKPLRTRRAKKWMTSALTDTRRRQRKLKKRLMQNT